MDPLTHTATGWLLARAGLDRVAPGATLTLVVAANVPSIDWLHLLGGGDSYLAHGYTWSHSLVGASALGAAVGLAFAQLARRKNKPTSGAKLMLLGVLGALSHTALDWMTARGTQLLWPFDRAWYALDWFPWIDLWLLVAMGLGVGLPALFKLVTEEIGARSTRAGARRGAWVALMGLVALAGLRWNLHGEAVAQLDARLYHGRTPLRVAAFPMPLNPFLWSGVAETESTHERVEVTLLGRRSEAEPHTLYKPAEASTLDAALAAGSAKVFLAWARFPRATLTPAAGGWEVQLDDLRFTGEDGRPRMFVVRIQVSQQLELVGEEIRFLPFGDE
ncbi:MAG: metal-dependent hydrolase [Acidobacteria bacterium]|nr:metal-dependent hydrolase [Acidobacteriota bacterium]